MADINASISHAGHKEGTVKVLTWSNLSAADPNGAEAEFPEWGDRCVQVAGTWGGGTVLIEGSNDGSNWFTLNDRQGSPLSFTADGLAQVEETPLYVRPSSSGGDGTQDLTVTLSMARPVTNANPR